jgi:hypothetical protein
VVRSLIGLYWFTTSPACVNSQNEWSGMRRRTANYAGFTTLELQRSGDFFARTSKISANVDETVHGGAPDDSVKAEID